MIKEYIKRYCDERWNIGFIQNSLDNILQGEDIRVQWVEHDYKNSWFADPFILDVTDTDIIVLVEEFPKNIYRGRISKLTIDRRSYQLKKMDTVKELPTHMSFPVIIRQPWFETSNGSTGDFVYLMPENGASGKLIVYKYWVQENIIEKVQNVLDESVADATPLRVGNKVYLFCTRKPNVNGNTLYVYQWNCQEEKFIPLGSKNFQENIARMAGNFFEYEGALYRPAQECNIQYGHAVSLQKVTCGGKSVWDMQALDCGTLEFKEVRRMFSNHPKLNVGLHTFNMYKGVIVTDALGFDNMWIRNSLSKFGIIH